MRLETPIHIHTAVWRSGLPWLIGLMARRGRLVALGFIALSALNEQLRFLGRILGKSGITQKTTGTDFQIFLPFGDDCTLEVC